MIYQIIQHVADRFHVDNDELTFTSQHNIGKDACITIIFYENQKPVCVGRVSRWNNDRVHQEYDSLTTLRDVVDEKSVEETIEAPLQIYEINGNSVLLTEAITGQTGREMTLSNNKKSRLVLIRAVEWLIKFQLNTSDLSTNDRNKKKKKLIQLSANENERYTSIFINNDDFSIGPVHGDFSTHNIIFSEQNELCGVIDFENCSMSGILFHDLMTLFLSVGIDRYGLNSEKVMNHLFIEGGDLTATVRKSLFLYCEEMNISPKVLMEVLPLHSDLEATRLQKRGQHGKTVDFHTELQSKLETIDKEFVQ